MFPITELNKQYTEALMEVGGENFQDSTPKTERLEKKLQDFFGERIKIQKGSKRRGNIVFSTDLDLNQVLRGEISLEDDVQMKIRDAAYAMRKAILQSVVTPLPESVTSENLMDGEIEAPDILENFLVHLIAGPVGNSNIQPSKVRRINSISQDIMYAVSSGKVKPSKQILLGMVTKSLTGSKKMVEMLNRLGHSVSYSAVEELETELTYSAAGNDLLTPDGMSLDCNSATGVAFDNYDRFVETLSGKNTLHDTVGIAYQTATAGKCKGKKRKSMKILSTQAKRQKPAPSESFDFEVMVQNKRVDITEESPKSVDQETTLGKKRAKRRRRTYDAHGLEIQPYRKKPKMISDQFYPIDHPSRHTNPATSDDARIKDRLWMINLSQNASGTAMWVGWNSKFDQSAKSTQNIWYLPQINESPTSHAVVAETLKRAIQIADECGKTQIASTYDLAIAKMALQIQKAESPLYDRVFVNLGAFHVELAFFCAVGKYIAESGGPFILSESGVLQSGSLKGFINGKAYNRCKRLHELLSASMETKLFHEFIKSSGEILVDDLLIEKKESLPLPLKENLSKEVLEVLQSYEDYRNDTLEGKHGKTAKFWAGYIEMVNLYHTFSRSIREGDFHLFIHCLPKITDYFFSFNHINYARWLVRFHDNLLEINETLPELSAEFQEGAFALKRTKKPFSGIPIDLTLEQTINADAASQRTGVTSMTNSIAARQRWAESHYIRTSLISHFFDELEMNTSDDTSKDLRAHRMHKNTADFLRIGKAIDETMNPFSKDIDPHHLFNIATGKSASDDTCNFLLDVASIGKKAREKFIAECIADPERFEKSLKKVKLSTFANEGVVKAVKGATKRLYEVKMERDLFGQIFMYSLQNKIDMGELLKYPLNPVPLTLSLSHIDGSMLKSPKAALLREIESRIVSAAPTRIDSVIIDVFFFLHLKQNLPESFGGVSKDIL